MALKYNKFINLLYINNKYTSDRIITVIYILYNNNISNNIYSITQLCINNLRVFHKYVLFVLMYYCQYTVNINNTIIYV